MIYDLNVLSLGAGTQSSFIYLAALHGMWDAPLEAAIFADTGWEPPAVYEYLDYLEGLGGDQIPIYRTQYGNLRQDMWDAVGAPARSIGGLSNPPLYIKQSVEESEAARIPPSSGGMLWRNCTRDYKINPIRKQVRTLLGYTTRQKVKKKVRQWIGISIDEATRMKDNGVGFIDNYYPLVEQNLSRTDCLAWIERRGYRLPAKSACVGCPYHSNDFWADMKRTRPDEWADAIQFDAHLRTGKLPGTTGDAYVHRAMLPLEEAVERTHNPDQGDLFNGFEQECEGMCGV